jgi:hypothetical protein
LVDSQCIESFEGTEVDGKKEGKGKIIYKKWDEYEGDFKNNLKDG